MSLSVHQRVALFWVVGASLLGQASLRMQAMQERIDRARDKPC